MRKKHFLLILVTLLVLIVMFSGCEQLKSLLPSKQNTEEKPKVNRFSFIEAYDKLEEFMKKQADDALFTGAVMMKTASEPWDGKATIWSAGFYSQKNKKAYIVVLHNGEAKIQKETKPDEGIKDRVITEKVAVDSTDVLEIAKATMITQIDKSKADAFKSLVIAYSNSLKKHVWAVEFDGNHRILVDAITGEVLEAK